MSTLRARIGIIGRPRYVGVTPTGQLDLGQLGTHVAAGLTGSPPKQPVMEYPPRG